MASADELRPRLAAAARASGRRATTHRYGPDPEQVCALMLPDGDGPHPVALLIHGGFWRAAFTRDLMDALACDLAGRGWASWNIEYRRTGNGGNPVTTLQDVGAAFDALLALDPRKTPLALQRGVTVIGHSAGGHLALCLAGRPEVALAISLAGVTELVTAARERLGDGAALAFAGAGPDERPELYAAADPIARLPTGTPVLLVHGDGDDRVPVHYSRRYAAAARAAGDPCRLLELPGVDHMALITPWHDAWRAIVAELPGPTA